MNELAANGMYGEVGAVGELNHVEGFDPSRYMRRIQQDGQPDRYYLDVVYRKLWFRLMHPEGKIVKKILKLTEQVAIVEARVYLHRNDPEDNFVSNALAQKYVSGDDTFGKKYVELAETAAVGRALSDAGFGLQFADWEGEYDLEVTDTPLEVKGYHKDIPEKQEMQIQNLPEDAGSGSAEEEEDYNIPGQYDISEYISSMATAPALEVPSAPDRRPAETGSAVRQSRPMNAAAGQTAHRQAPSVKTQGKQIRRDLPVEEIYAMLDPATAEAVEIHVGFNKGKTMGQVALTNPKNLEWYVKSYNGPDNLLRAAAKFLLDAALQSA